jgi:hypothetical protein
MSFLVIWCICLVSVLVVLSVDAHLWKKSDLHDMERIGNWPGSGYLTYIATRKRIKERRFNNTQQR